MSLFISPIAAGLPYTPYLTVAEYLGDPDAEDVSNLVPGGTVAQNNDALLQKIIQASSWMDRQVHYVLAATVDTETKKVRVRSDGTIRIVTKGQPFLELVSFSAGLFPSTMASIASSVTSDIWVEDFILEVPMFSNSPSGGAITAYAPGMRVYCKFTYVNGFPNTLTKTAVAAAATSLVVSNSLGIYPGRQLTIYDSGRTETILVDSAYVGGVGSSTTIPLLAGTTLLFAHSAGVSVSSLPATAKKAAILATSGHIKTKGGGSLIMDALDEHVGKEEHGEGEGLEDLAMAAAMLQTFRNPYYG